MIELKYEVPFSVHNRKGYGVSSKGLNKDKLQESLWKNRWFVEDLNEYFHNGDKYKVKAIIPIGIEKDNFGYYVDLRVYTDAETLNNNDIGAITDYIRGQVSDGWGENGFEIYDNMTLWLDHEGVFHNGFKFITDLDFTAFYDLFKGKQIKAIDEDEASKKFVENPTDESLIDLIDETIKGLLKLSNRLKKGE